MTGTPYDQARQRVRLEWGPEATAVVGPRTLAVVVDVLSFTTTVSVASDRGVAVLPWRWRDRGEQAAAYAEAHAADLGVGRSEAAGTLGALSLSPGSVRDAPVGLRRLVLPSPNGATVSLGLAETGAQVIAGSLRNRTAVAAWLAEGVGDPDVTVALVPAGERWGHDGPLRVAIEDAYGAGAVLEALLAASPDLTVSPEAGAALATWQAATRVGADVHDLLLATSSGRELLGAGHGSDVEIAAELDTSDAVPVLQGTSFVPAAGTDAMRAL